MRRYNSLGQSGGSLGCYFGWFLLFSSFVWSAAACIWDAETLDRERARHPTLAALVLSNAPATLSPTEISTLQARLSQLQAHPNLTNAAWYNDLAGAYLRLGQPAEAVTILETVTNEFAGDYGIHANLGTAYHLQGRYADAAREIARDLELNPNAHFGLEKYHLALLQYLERDQPYQSRHLYVDEFTGSFLAADQHPPTEMRIVDSGIRVDSPQSQTDRVEVVEQALAGLRAVAQTNWNSEIAALTSQLADSDPIPDYRRHWNLAMPGGVRNGLFPDFTNGVIYMAEMNPQEPACYTMLGVAAWCLHDYHLASQAFAKAQALHSPQTALLQARINELNAYILDSYRTNNHLTYSGFMNIVNMAVIMVMVVILIAVIRVGRTFWHKPERGIRSQPNTKATRSPWRKV
ncbi:MAG TPA: tetratricopeptide repeat protein [Verrucomicrobiae bacterium]